MAECYGQCLNAGICNNGQCACKEGFSGSNCQDASEPDAGSVASSLGSFIKSFALFAVLIAIIAGLFIAGKRLHEYAARKRELRKKLQAEADAKAAEAALLDK